MMYLLEETQEAREMREKVLNLLRTSDEGNLELAYQLIEGGGVHQDFVGTLCFWAIASGQQPMFELQNNNTIQSLKSILSEEDIEIVETLCINFSTWEGVVKQIQENNWLVNYQIEIIMCAFLIKKRCVHTCWEQEILPKHTILNGLIDSENSLDLTGLGLQELPKELANLPINTLDLQNNELKNLTKATWQNVSVTELWVDDDLSAQKLLWLKGYFPNLDDYCFSNAGQNARNNSAGAQRSNRMEEAKIYALQAIKYLRHISPQGRNFEYYHARAHAYNNAGLHEMAYVCHEHIRKTYPPKQYRSALYNMACNYARLHKTKEMYEYLVKFLHNPPYDVRAFIMEDNDLEEYHNDSLMLQLIQAREDFEDMQFKEFAKEFWVLVKERDI